MPLNYYKWAHLELSDDSDIEGHPNVGPSIRLNQHNIHDKRELRKYKINTLKAQIACNKVILPRIKKIYVDVGNPSSSTSAPAYFNALVARLQTNPSPDCPPGNNPTKLEQTYDGMLLGLLKMVGETATERVKESGTPEADKDAKLTEELTAEMEVHVKRLEEAIQKDEAELDTEEAELKKHIAMDDFHEGFESHYVPPTLAPPPVPVTAIKGGKGKEKAIEVLPASAQEAPDANDQENAEEGRPELTPTLEAFSKISLWNYEQSFQFIQSHHEVYVSGASDALLLAGFKAQGEDQTKYAKQCAHQSLLIQYREKLGRDGFGLFFKKMVSGDKRAHKVFVEDVEKTYEQLVNRVKVNKAEALNENREHIQLARKPGPGTEGLDIEEARRALQYRWCVFQGFKPDLQEALKLED